MMRKKKETLPPGDEATKRYAEAQAKSLLEQAKVDKLLTEGKVTEALALARKFGHEPHDDELRKEQLKRIRWESATPPFNLGNQVFAAEAAERAVKAEYTAMRSRGGKNKPEPPWHERALERAKIICARGAISQDDLADEVLDGWGKSPPSAVRMKIYLRGREKTGKLVRTAP